jgi:hypothetical protein
MKLPIIVTVAAGLLAGAIPTFAQTPPVHTSTDKTRSKAEHKGQWKDCMSRMEAKEKSKVNTGGQHSSNSKTPATAKDTAKTQPTNELKSERTNEGKMSRHEEMMQVCRKQLYGSQDEEGGKQVTPSPGAR